MDLLNITDLAETTLAQPLTDSATQLYVLDDITALTPPFVIRVAYGKDISALDAGEKIRVYAKDAVNSKLWYISDRGFDGSTAAAHVAGKMVLVPYGACYHQMLVDFFEIFTYALGRGADGIIRKDAADPGNLKVVEKAGMVVTVKAGLAMVGRKPFKLAVDTDITIPTSTAGVVQINPLKRIVEFAATLISGNMSIATIPSKTSIVQNDITDTRIFY